MALVLPIIVVWMHKLFFLFCFWACQNAAIIEAVNEDKARTTCV